MSGPIKSEANPLLVAAFQLILRAKAPVVTGYASQRGESVLLKLTLHN